MSKIYRTIQGDTWDMIALKNYEDEMRLDVLMEANREYIDTFIFPAGVVITLPEIALEVSTELPPWKQGGAVVVE